MIIFLILWLTGYIVCYFIYSTMNKKLAKTGLYIEYGWSYITWQLFFSITSWFGAMVLLIIAIGEPLYEYLEPKIKKLNIKPPKWL